MKLLHLYLRSRRAGQSYDNVWLDDYKLKSIKTYEDVAKHCRTAMQTRTPVRVHRRKFETFAASICCECYVQSITPEHDGFRVEFENWRPLTILLNKNMQRGYSFADPADYEER